MPYVRPELANPIPKAEEDALLSEYVRYHTELATSDRSKLNQKLPNDTFSDVLNNVGELLLAESGKLAKEPGPCRTFLECNPVPAGMAPLLPDSVRAFCLLLNALKQWVNKEQIAMDGYLFGRNVCFRQTCVPLAGCLRNRCAIRFGSRHRIVTGQEEGGRIRSISGVVIRVAMLAS